MVLRRALTRSGLAAIVILVSAGSASAVESSPPSGSSSPPPPPLVKPPAATDEQLDVLAARFAEDAKISKEEATRRLRVQHASDGLILKAKALLEDRYAGVWFDTDTGDVHVGVTSEADERAVRALLAEQFGADAAKVSAVVRVASSRADLQAAQQEINTELEQRKTRGLAWTAIDDVHNRVVIGLSSTADANDRQWAAGVRTGFAKGRVVATVASFPQLPGEVEQAARMPAQRRIVDVELQQLDGPAMAEPTIVRCTASTNSCDLPLRGGAGIGESAAGAAHCTNGYYGRWYNPGGWYEPFLITAGHCVSDSRGPYAARDYTYGNRWFDIGPRHTWRFGKFGSTTPGTRNDIGLIRVVPYSQFWWGDWAANVMWGWPGSDWQYWQLVGQDIPAPGRYGCRTGITTNFKCGAVQFQSQTVEVCADSFCFDTTFVDNNFNVPTACSAPGDSGGPFTDGGIALGIVSSRTPGTCSTSFQHVFDAGYWFGVWVDIA